MEFLIWVETRLDGRCRAALKWVFLNLSAGQALGEE
jgi:hypothetical protein